MPHCPAEVLEVPYHVNYPAILIGRSGMENVFEKADVQREVNVGHAEWIGSARMRVHWATGKIERRAVSRARLLNPKSPDFPSLHDLSAKMSPPNPKGGNGSYFQSADIGYYRLLDSLFTRGGKMVLRFWTFRNAHEAFLAHVKRQLNRLRSEQLRSARRKV